MNKRQNVMGTLFNFAQNPQTALAVNNHIPRWFSNYPCDHQAGERTSLNYKAIRKVPRLMITHICIRVLLFNAQHSVRLNVDFLCSSRSKSYSFDARKKVEIYNIRVGCFCERQKILSAKLWRTVFFFEKYKLKSSQKTKLLYF